MSATLEQPRKNLICNFRAPSEQMFADWKEYVAWCQDHGRDVCYLTLSLAKSFMLGVKGATEIKDPQQVINLQMNNQFTYAVTRPRREPYDLSMIREPFRRTFASVVYEYYILGRARELKREFSFHDFLEIEQPAFHRIVRRLIRKGKLAKNPLRSIPQFYFLTERLPEYAPRGEQT